MYPCDKHIFEETYDPVGGSSSNHIKTQVHGGKQVTEKCEYFWRHGQVKLCLHQQHEIKSGVITRDDLIIRDHDLMADVIKRPSEEDLRKSQDEHEKILEEDERTERDREETLAAEMRDDEAEQKHKKGMKRMRQKEHEAEEEQAAAEGDAERQEQEEYESQDREEGE